MKFDIQIVAIAKAESASAIYADDKDIENYAKRLNIPVVRICDLPLPPPPEEKPIEAGPLGTQMNLLPETQSAQPSPARQSMPEATAAERSRSTPDAGTPEADKKLEADPAHSPTVHGSDVGRGQGETARERKKEDQT